MKVECTKCCGTGKLIEHSHVISGVCFKCKGSGKQTKMKRVKVEDAWFSVECPNYGNKVSAKTEVEAKEIAEAWDSMNLSTDKKVLIITKSSFHYETIPA